ncbi:MAG: type II toxin-antitoxin system VapC family toxin [Thermonemataceae bacterium]|nr:type II toxin-antitoxin system VapC family toxin [Thermonemataceae bacterium]
MLLYDTNILLYMVRDNTKNKVQNIVNPFDQVSHICEVSIGELYSLSYQLAWGSVKTKKMKDILGILNILSINDVLVKQVYAEIDAYSKNKHPNLAKNSSSIKMGKNDIWIAAVASLLNLTLVTTDNDFDHLSGVFLDVKKIPTKYFAS